MIGNIYHGSGYWERFVVIRLHPNNYIEIKLLTKPGYYSYDLQRFGYAKIKRKSLKSYAMVTDKYDIAEIVKYYIVPKT